MTLNRTRSTFVVAAAMVAMLAMSVTAAFAQVPYPTSPAFGVSCVVSGDTVTCAVVGAETNEQLTATATCDGTVVFNETVTADGAGEATFSFAAGGAAACDVSVLGAASGNTGATLTVTAAPTPGTPGTEAPATGTPVTAAPTTGAPGTGGTLPFTGSEVTIFLAVGLALLAVGTVAVRRRGADA